MAELVVPVVFDDAVLMVDLEHLPGTAAAALSEVRAQGEREGGLQYKRLAACHSEGRDGTDLAGCVKTYVPWPTGPWGMVFRAGERAPPDPLRSTQSPTADDTQPAQDSSASIKSPIGD
jgi:hypothetical protein